ncbi:MAG: tRNA (N(6)-L-threonylcarbamoyladenosine(37)-C(2))-methylthiotransferase [Candidatus Micrarchaeales archaeon]|jgi:MiaB-like tRNA modifying enzyme, archaeal-type|uniref:tRNA-t(6)A37 methylthiotransferase n=1 Tax=Candidatus Micrarchaeum acidiphilum ARMAN-2 TaxID=425595 RepID=C7DG75_MICA2|nr:MAG: RNA modification enzyme, MiaB family [Candidatus Micrarchaeum acidiphilum ARMAN-2]MCW6161188.1 tRNA (N(6)-L-threonylcarbamoyladenosine(37)-C(2))-methylthiotransferase [Candidatus Micrarchaeales archaeon]
MQTYIKTYGCTLNQADSDIINSVLDSANIGQAESMQDADVIIVNTCTVKNPTEQKISDLLKKLESEKRKVLVTGCMAAANPDIISNASPSASIVTISNLEDMPDAVSRTASGERVVMSSLQKRDRLASFKPRQGPVARIPVSDGCMSSCSFCETKFARSALNSFSEDLILNAVKYSVKSGAVEIDITSQDIGAYGADRKSNIALLMEKISRIEGFFKVRIGMLNPERLAGYINEFASALGNEKFYKFAHLPLQSGSDSVLKSMRRNYTVDQYLEFVDVLRSYVPGISIETDMIVGYPTETDEDFTNSIEVLKSFRPDVTNISRFGARRHTAAHKMKQLDQTLIKERSSEMYSAVRGIQHGINGKFVGQRITALMTESTGVSINGRTDSYKQVVLRGASSDLIGKLINVSVHSATANALYCSVA